MSGKIASAKAGILFLAIRYSEGVGMCFIFVLLPDQFSSSIKGKFVALCFPEKRLRRKNAFED